jgi:RNA recognition motif-containing protein
LTFSIISFNFDSEQAFEQFGEIEEGAVITDKGTGKSRGFGFITFKHMDSAQRALREPSKNIDVSSTVNAEFSLPYILKISQCGTISFSVFSSAM